MSETETLAAARKTRKVCGVEGCDHPARKRGWCIAHYNSWKYHGDPLKAKPMRTPHGAAQSFLASVLDGSAPVETNGCILWPYSTSSGYAQIGNGRGGIVHVGRVVLTHLVGPPPSPKHTMGHALHDVCGNRHCVAPSHLSWQTPAEQSYNMQQDGTLHPPRVVLGVDHHKATATDEQVASAVARVRAGETRVSVAADVGVSVSTLKLWLNGTFRKAALR